jgi:hypothetical protein
VLVWWFKLEINEAQQTPSEKDTPSRCTATIVTKSPFRRVRLVNRSRSNQLSWVQYITSINKVKTCLSVHSHRSRYRLTS